MFLFRCPRVCVCVCVDINVKPYRGRLCGLISTTAQLSILFSYITAILLTNQPTLTAAQNDWVGLVIMVSNLACFIVLAFFFIKQASKESDADSRLTLALNGAPVQLFEPTTPGGHHIFLSHCWTWAQDQCSDIKRSLQMAMPNAQIFLEYVAKLERNCDTLRAESTAHVCLA